MGQVRICAIAYYDEHEVEPNFTANKAFYAVNTHPFPDRKTGRGHRAAVANMLIDEAVEECNRFLTDNGVDPETARIRLTIRAEVPTEGYLIQTVARIRGFRAEYLD